MSHLFICLGSNSVEKWVSGDRLELELAGLGERNIEFEDANSIDSLKLANEGGYEFMRFPPNCRTLEIIELPAEGYTPLFLSRVKGTAQTCIGPISRSLDMSKVERQYLVASIHKYIIVLRQITQ